MWLQGEFGRKHRPDRLGIVFAVGEMPFGQVVMAYVRKPGADKTGVGAELLNIVGSQIPVCILRSDGTRAVLLPEDRKDIAAQIRAEMDAKATVDEDGRLRRLPVV